MAKYVYCLPGDIPQSKASSASRDWDKLSLEFGDDLAEDLYERFGLPTQIFLDEDGVEICKGTAALGKDWFSFQFRVFSDLSIYLAMLNVPLEFRSRGVGGFIVEELKAFAEFSAIKYIFLDAYDPANSFWESCGFVKILDHPELILGFNYFHNNQGNVGLQSC